MSNFVTLAFVLWKSLHSPRLNMDNRDYLVQTQNKIKQSINQSINFI